MKGLQGDDPRYYKTVATAKHFAVHSGPEQDRHHFDVHPSERDLWETYLPAFKDLVVEAKAASVMGAYNRVNGESASASQRLLGDILRRDWGFTGYVVSDCGSIDDIHARHKIVATPEEAAALGVTKGCDLECGSVYKTLGTALERGLLKESDLDVALVRLFTARFRLGMFDPPERVRFAQTPYSVNDSPEHDRLAREVARESIVLLKNGGVLPLKKDIGTIAVVGPTADDLVTLLGNYHGTPTHPVTILAGIRKAVSPKTKVIYARGVDLVEGRQDPRAATAIDSSYLRPARGSSERGLKGEYFRGKECSGEPVLTRVDAKPDFRWDRSSPTDEAVARGELAASKALDGDNFCIRWTGFLVPPASGEYEITVTANDGARLLVDGQKVLEDWSDTSVARAVSGRVKLEKGKEHELKLEYYEDIRDAEVRLGWKLPGGGTPFEEAVAAAEAADVVVFVGGLTAEVEGEEMRVNYPGFAGGDRTDIELPVVQRKLVEALHATGKPVVLVLTTGSALGLRWAQETLPAIVVAWYPGQRGGDAVADVLFGDTSPAGRLPVTFYESVADLPGFSDYAMEGRTLPLLPRQAGVRVRPRALVHALRVLGAEAVAPARGCERHARRLGRRQEHGRPRGRRGGAALRAQHRRRRQVAEPVAPRVRAGRAQGRRAADRPLQARAGARPRALRRGAQGARGRAGGVRGRDRRLERGRAGAGAVHGRELTGSGLELGSGFQTRGSETRESAIWATIQDLTPLRGRPTRRTANSTASAAAKRSGSRRSAFTRQTKCTTPQTAAA